MKVEYYVIDLFDKHFDRKYSFHSLSHATTVVDKAPELAIAESFQHKK